MSGRSIIFPNDCENLCANTGVWEYAISTKYTYYSFIDKMVSSEDELDDRSSQISNYGGIGASICNHCNRKVVDSVKCVKCKVHLHPACLKQANLKKSPVCIHVQDREMETNQDRISNVGDVYSELRYLRMKVKYLSELLQESNSKNLLLIENNKLLIEKMRNMEEQEFVKSKKGKQNKQKHHDNIVPAHSVTQKKPVNVDSVSVGSRGDVDIDNSSYRDVVISRERLTEAVASALETVNNNKREIISSQLATRNNDLKLVNKSKSDNNLKQSGSERVNNEKWTVVTKRKHTKKAASIVGRGQVVGNIKVNPKKAFLFISRLQPGTKPEDLRNLLQDKFL